MTEYPPWDSFSIIPLFLANLVSILSVKNSCKTIFYMYDLITRDTITWLLASGRGTPLFCLHRDMLLNRVRFIDLAVLNRVYNFTSLCPKQGWVGSPLSPACKSQWASIKQLGQRSLWQEAPRKWTCLDLCKVFISTSPDQSELPLTEKREKWELNAWQTFVLFKRRDAMSGF